jgi:hypothetical protein
MAKDSKRELGTLLVAELINFSVLPLTHLPQRVISSSVFLGK